jgi:phage tail tape-measure protein
LDTRSVQKREVVVALLTAAATAAAGEAAIQAVKAVSGLIKNLGDWTEARESFTKQTTSNMMKKNPDPNKYPAAICYNKGWRVKDNAKISEVVSAKLKLGVLNTE